MISTCEGCGADLPGSNGNRPRKWCGEACRKRTARDEAPVVMPSSVVAAVRAAFDVHGDLDAVDEARVQMALALAALIDAGGGQAVGAARELRGILADLSTAADDDTKAFLRLVLTPGIAGGDSR